MIRLREALLAAALAGLTGTTGNLALAADASDAPPAAPAATAPAAGLAYVSIQDGTGPTPGPDDIVRVHYRGTLMNGQEFDSSYRRGKPAEFPLSRVIRCWTEGVQRMKVGGKAKLTCPPEFAYGARGAGGVIPPNATLQFEIELLGIVTPAVR